jgi:hypothetical protein
MCSMLGIRSGTESDEVCFPVHGGWDSRYVSVVGVFAMCTLLGLHSGTDSDEHCSLM